MGLFDRIRYKGAPETPRDADALALRQLAGSGADLTRPRHVIHFLYFSAEANARAAADAIGEASWKTEVEAPTETIEDWCIRADDYRVVGPDTIAGFRAWFEDVAETHGGEYDGWEAARKP